MYIGKCKDPSTASSHTHTHTHRRNRDTVKERKTIQGVRKYLEGSFSDPKPLPTSMKGFAACTLPGKATSPTLPYPLPSHSHFSRTSHPPGQGLHPPHARVWPPQQRAFTLTQEPGYLLLSSARQNLSIETIILRRVQILANMLPSRLSLGLSVPCIGLGT